MTSHEIQPGGQGGEHPEVVWRVAESPLIGSVDHTPLVAGEPLPYFVKSRQSLSGEEILYYTVKIDTDRGTVRGSLASSLVEAKIEVLKLAGLFDPERFLTD